MSTRHPVADAETNVACMSRTPLPPVFRAARIAEETSTTGASNRCNPLVRCPAVKALPLRRAGVVDGRTNPAPQGGVAVVRNVAISRGQNRHVNGQRVPVDAERL